MKRLFKSGKMNKGAPSGFVASLLFHGAAFFIAGLFVVFTVVAKNEPEFVAPQPIERPKMNLKKPKVKIKKSSQPKPSSRIVAKVKTRDMPEIQLPDLMGSGDGLLSGVGLGDEFINIPEFSTVTLMGSTESIGTDLVGVYYDMKRWSNGNVNGFDKLSFMSAVRKFIDRGWDESVLNKFYKLPRQLYVSALVVPVVPSSFAPIAFGDENASEGSRWVVHYKGKLAHKEGITFRFWAAGDMFLIVRVDGKIVVASVWDFRDERRGHFQQVVGSAWTPHAVEHKQYICGLGQLAAVGDWITLEPGVAKDIEILVGDDAGQAAAYLMVQEKGVKYPSSVQGGPILPAFRTSELSHDMLDAVYPFLAKDEMICMTNGPIFNDL